eukprot:9968453-Alexandrium_andersonii.AAC.1
MACARRPWVLPRRSAFTRENLCSQPSSRRLPSHPQMIRRVASIARWGLGGWATPCSAGAAAVGPPL